jgi:hypothetical protein
MVCVAKTSCRFNQSIQYLRQIECGAANDPEQLGSCGLLFLRLVQFAGEPRDLGFLASRGRTVLAHSLQGFRLAASRGSHFAACSGAPSHCLSPKAQAARLWLAMMRLHQGFAAGGMGLDDQFAPQKSQGVTSPKADIAERDRHADPVRRKVRRTTAPGQAVSCASFA